MRGHTCSFAVHGPCAAMVNVNKHGLLVLGPRFGERVVGEHEVFADFVLLRDFAQFFELLPVVALLVQSAKPAHASTREREKNMENRRSVLYQHLKDHGARTNTHTHTHNNAAHEE